MPPFTPNGMYIGRASSPGPGDAYADPRRGGALGVAVLPRVTAWIGRACGTVVRRGLAAKYKGKSGRRGNEES